MKKKTKGKYMNSGERESAFPEIVTAGEHSDSSFVYEEGLANPNPLLYLNNAVPKLRASIIVTTDEQGDIEDAHVVQQILKKDRIRSSVYEISKITENTLAETIKSSCCVFVNNPAYFKDIAIRSMLSGRFVLTWFPTPSLSDECEDYYNSPWCVHLRNISKVAEGVRYIKSQYRTGIIEDIRLFIMNRIDFK